MSSWRSCLLELLNKAQKGKRTKDPGKIRALSPEATQLNGKIISYPHAWILSAESNIVWQKNGT